MIVKKDINKNSLYFVDNNDVVFRTSHIGAEFLIIKSTDNPISITENDNKYVFDNKLSSMIDNRIIWFSDQTCDIENKRETDRVNRIVIERSYDSIIITCYNPFYERNNIRKSQYAVAFSP